MTDRPMRRTYSRLALMPLLVLPVAACGDGGGSRLATFTDSASYAIGLSMGRSVQEVRDDVAIEQLIQGLRDAAEGAEYQLTEAEVSALLRRFTTRVQESQVERQEETAMDNRTKGDEFRQSNGAREGVVTTASGLQYEVLEEGGGESPAPSDPVTVHYRGTLIDGTEFDSSYERGEPAVFVPTQVIAGWTEVLQLMRPGSKYRVVIPPELGYGRQGAGADIPPDATLVFEIELLSVQR